jgi:hypothetical protein
MMLSLACVNIESVGFPSVEMWFDRGEDRCYGLSKVGMVETVGIRSVMWLVMLESTMGRILDVDTPRQHVSPRVLYGMACLLISYAMGYVSCSVEWGWHHTLWSYFMNWLNHMVQEGMFVWETLALQAGTVCLGNHSKSWHTPIVDLCNNM